jgi:hypothetical protein
MKQMEISLNKIGILKLTRLAGIIFGLMMVHFLTVNANAQVNASRPGAYNTQISYGSNRDTGLRTEDRSYDEYQRRVSFYEKAKRVKIDEEWHDCYRQATNAAAAKVCSDTSQRDVSDLAMDVRRLQDAAYIEYLRRKDLINKYWNDRS